MKDKQNPKKKILWIAGIATVFAASALVICFIRMNAEQTISGEWEMIVNPEITDPVSSTQKVYYTFSQPGQYGDGTYRTIFDSGIEKGGYKLSEKDGISYINMGTLDLAYKIEGSELTITYPESTDPQTGEKIPEEDYILKRAKAPDYETESYESFTADKALFAAWITEERTLSYYTTELSYTETVEFLESGVMVIHYDSEDLFLDRYMYYAYTTENNTLTFSPVTDKETKYQVSYTLDENGNLRFENDAASGSIFADAFFSDVIYYPQKDGNQ